MPDKEIPHELAKDDGDEHADEGGGYSETIIVFGDDEGEVIDGRPWKLPPPGAPEAPVPWTPDDNYTGPQIGLPSGAQQAREKFGAYLSEDAIRDLLNTPELTAEDRDHLWDLLQETYAANNRDPIDEDPAKPSGEEEDGEFEIPEILIE